MGVKKIIIATKNMGKAKEFKALFEPYAIKVETLYDYPEISDIIETGTTFKENAFQKAQQISDLLNQVVLADDSGLQVDALNGAPGVYSARYAGEPANDDHNNQKLLKALENVPSEKRSAHFHCSLVLVGKDREPLHVEGEVSGIILKAPRGTNGFGYDPLFYMAAYDKTMAELPNEEKNKISHRAVAIRQLKDYLHEWL